MSGGDHQFTLRLEKPGNLDLKNGTLLALTLPEGSFNLAHPKASTGLCVFPYEGAFPKVTIICTVPTSNIRNYKEINQAKLSN